MKIVITTVGTRGDLQPYIALGLGLKQAGYQVQVVSAKNEEAFVRHYGLDFYALDVDIQKIMESGQVNEMGKGNNPLKFILGHLKSSRNLKKQMVKTQGEIWKACADADGVIFHPGIPLGVFWAKHYHKKGILASPFPIVATKNYPSVLFYAMPKWGSYYNLLTHFIFDRVFWALAKSPIREFWRTNIKSKMNFSVSPVKQQMESGQLVLNAYSPYLFAQDSHWKNNIQTTGSWIIENEPDFVSPDGLSQFIDNGEPPVYIGFGSMKAEGDFRQIMEMITKALKLTQQRAVVSLGWTKNEYKESLPDNLYLIGSVPHTWLFPKMKMLIHHGGAGTTAAGLREGKPTIIIPHNADQPAWGQRVFELGVGPKPIRKTKLTADNLANAILFSQSDHIVENAKLLGQKLKAENGVQAAVELIKKWMV